MHPRLLAPNGGPCTGGSCPAVYALDDAPGQLMIRGKDAGAALSGSCPGRADGESDVIISRELVLDALRVPDEPAGPDVLMTHLETFQYTAFRLEAQQVYADTGRDEQWEALVKAGRRWGKTFQRVHVVTEPLTASMQQELTEGYGPSTAAGEQIRIIPVPEGSGWPEAIPDYDFWLFDSSELLVMHYEPDGTWTGASWIADPHRIVQACRVRDAAWRRSHPWDAYISARPDLQRRVAQ